MATELVLVGMACFVGGGVAALVVSSLMDMRKRKRRPKEITSVRINGE